MNSLLKKVAIGVTGALCVVFFFLFELSKSVEAGNATTSVVYPSGNLSDNLFVSQNSEYVESSSLPVSYEFEEVPYVVDLPKGNTANVGTGHIVQANDDLVIYVSEMSGSTDVHSVVLSQYPKVVYINYSQTDSYSMTLKEEYGYMNGYPTTYFMDHLVVSTGSNDAKNAYVLGYCYEPENEVGNKILISVATTSGTTENFEACKAVLDTVAYTCRYSEKLDSVQIKKRADARKAAENYQKSIEKQKAQEEKAAAKAAKSSTVTSQNVTSATDSFTPITTTGNGYSSENMSVPISVTSDFANLSILCNWTNSSEDVSISFSGPNGVVTPELLTSKQATINIGYCPTGEYSLNVTNYSALGEFNTKLIENGH